MSDSVDLSFLDRPEILSFIFYPRRDFGESRVGTTHFIEVEEGVDIGCRFYLSGKDNPSILYFHGNGETVGDYDWVSPSFTRRGINLFVADYRGYGVSDGSPTISNLVKDAHPIFKGFKEIVAQEKCRNSLFLMGRSLGSVPTLELAYHYQDEVKGLIIESGPADTFNILFSLFGFEISPSLREKLEAASNKAKIREVHIPTLIIHAEQDSLIPLSEGKALYQNSGAKNKELYIIPGADHNTLWLVAGEEYYQRIEEFVKKYG